MSYTIDRILTGASFDEAEARTRKALAGAGFGVLTEINVAGVMKAKLGREMPAYLILGACNPGLAWQAIEGEPKIGAMLPCNVILREVAGGVEVSAIDPVASMMAVENSGLGAVATRVRQILADAVAAI